MNEDINIEARKKKLKMSLNRIIIFTGGTKWKYKTGTFGKEIMHNNIRDRMKLLEENLSDFSLKSAYKGD